MDGRKLTSLSKASPKERWVSEVRECRSLLNRYPTPYATHSEVAAEMPRSASSQIYLEEGVVNMKTQSSRR